MHRFWSSYIAPVLEIVEPAVIVEIGAASGLNTRRLLEFCAARGARCHVIDPRLPRNYEEIRPLLDRYGQLHQDISLNFLPEIAADLYLIDGDHNWYTVRHELAAIEQGVQRRGRAFPVLLLHDVLWPYARRDQYYAVERIPERYVHPAATGGVVPGRADLVERGGLARSVPKALHEGGQRNGVLTAVEDFIHDSRRALTLMIVPGFFGLAAVFEEAALSDTVRRRLVELFSLPEHARAHIEALEVDRIRHQLIAKERREAQPRRRPWPLRLGRGRQGK